MVLAVIIGVISGLLTSLFVLYFNLPTKVQYLEEILIKAPPKAIYDAIRYQEQLMKWSAWPSATKSQCAVRNVDGQLGAQTVYLQKGKQFGYQEVIALVANEKVSFYLTSNAPFEQNTRLHFYLNEIDVEHTRVLLYFDNTLKRPSHIFPYVFGIIQWTHNMHLKDLAGLKKFAENNK